MSSLIRGKSFKPADCGAVFKFENIGDTIHAKFIGRRTAKTKTQDNAAILDCNIIESTKWERGRESEGPTGEHSIFESNHITNLLDKASPQSGDEFVLSFCEVDKKTRFKRFYFQRVNADSDSGWPADGEEPPPEFFDDERAHG